MSEETGVTPEETEIEESSTSEDDRFLPQPEDEEDQPTDAQSEQESDEESDEEPVEKPKKGVQKRFSELTARAKAAEQERDYIAKQNQQLMERLMALNQVQTPQQKAETAQNAPVPPGLPPDRYDFASDSEFEKAVSEYQKRTVDYTRFLIREEHKASQREQQQTVLQQQQVAAQRQIVEKIGTIKEKGAEKYEDFDEVAFIPTSVVGLVSQMENADELAYHWGKNPKDRQMIDELAKTNPIRCAMLIGEMNARVSAKQQEQTSAPPPPKTVGGNNRAKPNPDQLSVDEWVKLRRAGKIK